MDTTSPRLDLLIVGGFNPKEEEGLLFAHRLIEADLQHARR